MCDLLISFIVLIVCLLNLQSGYLKTMLVFKFIRRVIYFKFKRTLDELAGTRLMNVRAINFENRLTLGRL